jgi:hypothetical protein
MNVSVHGILDHYRKENDIMKTKLHQLIGTAMLGLALLSHSLPAWAGAVISDVVYISSNGTVRGSLTGARYGFYNTYIGCHHYRHAVQNTSFVACQAQDKYGRIALCTSTDQRIIDAVKGMTDSSHLLFRVSSLPQGTCTELTISNESVYLR